MILTSHLPGTRQNSHRAALRTGRRSILATAILPMAAVLLALPASTSADAIFAPGNAIVGGRLDLGLNQFQVGTVGTTLDTNNWPAAESPDHAIDGVGQKYLNFAETYTGFLVNPSFNNGNGSVATSIQLWTANDSPARDPSSYEIWGTNAALDFGSFSFDMSAFTQISAGSLALPATRNPGGLAALNVANSQTVTFANTDAYKNYLIVFPTIKDAAATNSMQIAEVQLFGTASFIKLTWTGSVSEVWNVGTTSNWEIDGGAATYAEGDGVVFTDVVPPGRSDITITAGGLGVKPSAVFFENDAVNYSISGEQIVSPGSLVLDGTGTVTLNNANSYAGGTTVNAGTLVIGPTGSLGPGALRVNNPNTGPGQMVMVQFDSPQVVGSLSGTMAFPSSGINTSVIFLNGGLTINQSEPGTFAGDILGAGGLIKAGASILTLTGGNIYGGPTTILAGTLSSSRPGGNADGALPAGQPVIIQPGATLHFGADEGAGFGSGSVSSITATAGTITGAANTRSTLPALLLEGSTVAAADAGTFLNGVRVNYVLDGDVTTAASAARSRFTAASILLRKDPAGGGVSAPVNFNVPRGTAAVDLEVQSTIHDLGAGLIKTGDGILAIPNPSTYTGPTVLAAGTLIAGSSGSLGTGSVTIADGAVLSIAAPTMLSGFTGFSLNNGATLDGTSSLLTLTSNLGNQSRSAFTTTPVNVAGGFMASFVYTAGGNRAADGFTFTLQNSSPTAVGTGGGQLGYTGIPKSAAVLFNIYTGAGQPVGTNVASGSTGGYLPSAPVNLAGGNPIQIDLVYDGAAGTVTEVLTDTVTNDTYSNIFGGVDLASFIGGNSAFVGFTGATGGQFAEQTIRDFTFTNRPGELTLGNLFGVADGATAAIEIQPNADGSPASATLGGAVTIGASGTLRASGGAQGTGAPYTLTLGGGMVLGGDATIRVENNGAGTGTVVASLPITETAEANLIKAGPGTLVLAGASTFQGTTTVSEGTLLVTGSLSGVATFVNNSATLAGTGNLTAVFVDTGGKLAPGNSGIGTLEMSELSLLDGSVFSLEIGTGTADVAEVIGAGTIAGNVSLALALTADPADFQSFTILDGGAPLLGYSSGARLSFFGNPLDEGEAFTVATGEFSQEFVISYQADGGNDVTLTAVPEPATAAFLLLGLGATLRRKRTAVSAAARGK